MFTPSVEAVNDSNTFLVSKPRSILEDGKLVNKVPWITGVLSEEGLLYALGEDPSHILTFYVLLDFSIFHLCEIRNTQRSGCDRKAQFKLDALGSNHVRL